MIKVISGIVDIVDFVDDRVLHSIALENGDYNVEYNEENQSLTVLPILINTEVDIQPSSCRFTLNNRFGAIFDSAVLNLPDYKRLADGIFLSRGRRMTKFTENGMVFQGEAGPIGVRLDYYIVDNNIVGFRLRLENKLKICDLCGSMTENIDDKGRCKRCQ